MNGMLLSVCSYKNPLILFICLSCLIIPDHYSNEQSLLTPHNNIHIIVNLLPNTASLLIRMSATEHNVALLLPSALVRFSMASTQAARKSIKEEFAIQMQHLNALLHTQEASTNSLSSIKFEGEVTLE